MMDYEVYQPNPSMESIDEFLLSMELAIRQQHKTHSFSQDFKEKQQKHFDNIKESVESVRALLLYKEYTDITIIYNIIVDCYMLGFLSGNKMDIEDASKMLKRRNTEAARKKIQIGREEYVKLIERHTRLYQSKPENRKKSSVRAIADAIFAKVEIEWISLSNDDSQNPKKVTLRSVLDTVRKITKKKQ